MTSTAPNKEIVRRICHLAGATECYLHVKKKDNIVEVLTNITDEATTNCLTELESWAGMKFKLYNYSNNKIIINRIITYGEKILPIKL